MSENVKVILMGPGPEGTPEGTVKVEFSYGEEPVRLFDDFDAAGYFCLRRSREDGSIVAAVLQENPDVAAAMLADVKWPDVLEEPK